VEAAHTRAHIGAITVSAPGISFMFHYRISDDFAHARCPRNRKLLGNISYTALDLETFWKLLGKLL
jgi:hypothetical protein